MSPHRQCCTALLSCLVLPYYCTQATALLHDLVHASPPPSSPPSHPTPWSPRSRLRRLPGSWLRSWGWMSSPSCPTLCWCVCMCAPAHALPGACQRLAGGTS
jgi:hypothetical protein